MIILPVDDTLPNFEQQQELDGATYTIRMRWNPRARRWFVSILDEDGVTPLHMGIAAVVNWPLLAYKTGHLPPGALLFGDKSGAGVEAGAPGTGDLGARVQPYYLNQGELASGTPDPT